MQNTSELADLIRYHSDKYFNDDAEITDAEFDELVKEMKQIDPDNPVLAEVGAPTYGKKVSHSEVMGSLNKVNYDETEDGSDQISELQQWASKTAGKGEFLSLGPKIDGLAVELEYDNGDLIQASTRGNGKVGQDVTDNVREIASIPNSIECKENVRVRGEIYMKKSVFNAILKEMVDNGEDAPKNPRNLASGTLNQKDAKETGKRPLHLFVYDLRGIDSIADTEFAIYHKAQETFSEFDFVLSQVISTDAGDIMAAIKGWEAKRDSLDYSIDGIVFSVNNKDKQDELGYKGKCPIGKIAFKFRPTQKTSIVLNVGWQLGRTGRITPVSQLKPVEIDGSLIESPTMHNLKQTILKNICIGDEVLVEKAGDIIPQIVRVIKKGKYDHEDEWTTEQYTKALNYPFTCPACDGETVVDDNGVSVWCRNILCPGQAESRMVHFLKTIDVDGVGPGIVNKLFESGLVKSIPDLFNLNFDEVSKLDRMGRSSARNTLDAIAAKTEIPLAVFLDSLGINGLGTTTSKNIATEFKSLKEVLTKHPADLIKLPDIGVKTAPSICNGLVLLGGMIDEIQQSGVKIIDMEIAEGGLTGKSFCVTGTLSVGRKEMQALIESHGGKIKSSVGKGLDYLVAGDGVGAGKTDKAEKFGTAVISEEEARKMME